MINETKTINTLEARCGDCPIIEYCDNPFGFAVCHDERFAEMQTSEYLEIAEKFKGADTLDVCEGCKRSCCDTYSDGKGGVFESCEHWDESKDHFCYSVANFVAKQVVKRDYGAQIQKYLKIIEDANFEVANLLNKMLLDSTLSDLQKDVQYALNGDLMRGERLLRGILEVLSKAS